MQKHSLGHCEDTINVNDKDYSIQVSHSVMSDSLQPHGLQHTKTPCPSPTPRIYLDSLNWLCHPSISSSVFPFSSCIQSFPVSGSFHQYQALFIRQPNYWSFCFNIRASNEHSGLISYRMDWLDLLAIQGTLKSLLQHHSSKASVLWPSAFFIVQLSHPYMTTGKTIALTRQTFVGKVMSLLFIMLSMLVINFLQRSKHVINVPESHVNTWNSIQIQIIADLLVSPHPVPSFSFFVYFLN